MSIPKCVVEVIEQLRQERMPLADRVDAIDLAIENLQRIWGVHGDQPTLAFEQKSRVLAKSTNQTSTAQERQDVLLTLLSKAEHGLTLMDLRGLTPKMSGKDRSNALQRLKALGHIKRSRKLWLRAA